MNDTCSPAAAHRDAHVWSHVNASAWCGECGTWCDDPDCYTVPEPIHE